jgi:hypothetical protein
MPKKKKTKTYDEEMKDIMVEVGQALKREEEFKRQQNKLEYEEPKKKEKARD